MNATPHNNYDNKRSKSHTDTSILTNSNRDNTTQKELQVTITREVEMRGYHIPCPKVIQRESVGGVKSAYTLAYTNKWFEDSGSLNIELKATINKLNDRQNSGVKNYDMALGVDIRYLAQIEKGIGEAQGSPLSKQ